MADGEHTLDAAEAAIAQLAGELAHIAAREDEVARAAKVPWSAVPGSGALPELGDQPLSVLTPPAAETGDLLAEQITALAATFAADADMLEGGSGRWPGWPAC